LSGQEGIYEKPEFTAVNKYEELITDELRGLKATVSEEAYYCNKI